MLGFTQMTWALPSKSLLLNFTAGNITFTTRFLMQAKSSPVVGIQ